jgi:hypothetical protein
VVGEEDVKSYNEINRLRQGAGLFVPLKNKGYFERFPHLLRRAALIAGAIIALAAIAAWSAFTPDPPRYCTFSTTPPSSIQYPDWGLKMRPCTFPRAVMI